MIRSLATAVALVFAGAVQAAPLKFAVTDIEGLEALQQEFAPFEEALEAASGQDIELLPVSSRTAAVEALK